MLESILSNLATSLVDLLCSSAMDEFSLLRDSKGQLRSLQGTIRTLNNVLQDASRRRANEATVRDWLLSLEDVVYKADDFFDEISARASAGHGRRSIFSLLFHRVVLDFVTSPKRLIYTAHKVKILRERLDYIAKDIHQFNFLICNPDDGNRASSLNTRPRSHSFVRSDNIIGRGRELEDIVHLLLADGGEHVSVIPIVGIGGQGKTALAQLVYNDKRVEHHFPLQLWACVNYLSYLSDVLQYIVGAGTSQKHSTHDAEQLKNMLLDKIGGKRFLLVLDEVWDHVRENWLKLKDLLLAGGKGSKVLLTTRKETVAQNLGTGKYICRLGGLSVEDAWSLFKQMAFDTTEPNLDQDMEILGRQIVEKCANVPLAIRSVGSFLFRKDIKQWSSVLNNELAKIIPESENFIKQFLMISYSDLPPSLKRCFEYCSLFPKDYRFSKNTLILLWMAQGFLEPSCDGESLEDVGERYFSGLIDRCFFQDVWQSGYFGNGLIRCRMHDLLHDLAVDVSGSECLLMKTTTITDLKKSTARHVALNHEADFSKNILSYWKTVRTLLFHNGKLETEQNSTEWF